MTDQPRDLTFDDFTRNDFTKAVALLEKLTPDIVVEKCDHPASDHLHVSFIVPDTEQPSNIFPKYLEPAIQSLAKVLPNTPKAVVQILPRALRMLRVRATTTFLITFGPCVAW